MSITGCCHQGIILFADTAYKELAYEKDQFYGLYGGLHISPFDDWDPKYDDLVIGLKKWNLQQVGCNHCTGLITAQKFVDAGYPVVKGTARFRSKTTNYPPFPKPAGAEPVPPFPKVFLCIGSLFACVFTC